MDRWLRQSTSVTMKIGSFVDATDADTANIGSGAAIADDGTTFTRGQYT